MKVSLNWIKKYVFPINMNQNQISNILTDIGLTVKAINNVNNDFILDIEITPNRTDAMSHYGIARDLYAVLRFRGYKVHLLKPKINEDYCYQSHIKIFVQEYDKCIRYSGIFISGIKIEKSPYWLISQLESIGIRSINNIIDIMHFVMYELGQPVHIFNMNQIKDVKIVIKNAENNTHFQYSDNIKIKLDKEDLVIYDNAHPLSIGGIINHVESNINVKTTNIFVGSACWHSTIIRNIKKKYSKKIKTQYPYFFEKDIDPNQTVYALQRIAFLIKEIIRNKIVCSNVIDFYPNPIYFSKIKLRYNKIINILGKKISIKNIKKILSLLEMKIDYENQKYLFIEVPSYRTDVKREIDVIEEILRIYGIHKIPIYNNQVKISTHIKFFEKTEYEIQKILFEQLINYGFQEIISSTMINEKKYSYFFNSFLKRKEIQVMNPVNQSYKFMRSSLLFSMIDCIEYNYKNNRIKSYIKFFELGKIYYKKNDKFLEKPYLGIAIAISKKEKTEYNYYSFFYLKGIIEQILQKSGIYNYTQILSEHPLLENGISILYNHKNLIEIGKFKRTILKKNEIFYAEIDWKYLISIIKEKKIIYIPLSKYPTSKRDLSLFVDQTISFEKINQLIKKRENHIIKKVEIYDLYKGINFPTSKKSYTISFFFESKKETLTEEIINDSMKEIEFFLKKELKAEIRKK
ncbi:phenylalanine--tRNA ligase subunit beta [Blattabacterium cuenoti]|uniref:phenylalanine--tRNA ligase subunit beta n=1 Tax=Blattabacterium cuenoti TaxID=1653831 RepID=UPI00163CF9BD|nr:phenylalanine--tRNA ligase subunit beta [Blattabacterium cuenoti]